MFNRLTTCDLLVYLMLRGEIKNYSLINSFLSKIASVRYKINSTRATLK